MAGEPRPGLPYVLPDSVVVDIPPAESSTGSGFGVSYWESFNACARRGVLERQTGRSTDIPRDAEGNRKVGRYNKPVLNQTKIGILFHKILEHYHAHEGCACVFRYQQAPDDLEWQEALRYFETYRECVPADRFGKVVACEEEFRYGCREGCTDNYACVGHVCDGEKAVGLLGVPYFTGRRDMRTVVDQKALDYWQPYSGLLEVGDCLLVDTKTKTADYQTTLPAAMESLQFHAYMMVARALGLPVKGLIANVVVGTSQVKCFQYFIPYPTERQAQMVKERLSRAYWLREKLGETAPNPAHCFDWFKVCPFFQKECDLVGLTLPKD